MAPLALFGGSFLEPTPWDWLFGAGIGTNLGAALVGILVGYLYARTKFLAVKQHISKTHELVEEVHQLTHTGEVHPRVAARRAAGEPVTPALAARKGRLRR